MPEIRPTHRIARFAAFEFHLETRELRKHGLRIRLGGQPVELLAVLIERAGEIVSREELRKRLWQAGTFVDFEHSLNAAIKRLRAALSDSAEAPRFVETIARQGYRFVAPVAFSGNSDPAAVQPVEKPPRRYPLWAAVPLTLLAIAIGLWLQSTEYFWRSPIARARFQLVTDFEGVEQAAALSRDGRFLAFLSDRDGQMDVWATQTGSGQFHNLTGGRAEELVNPSIRTLAFSPDGSLVTYWMRRHGESGPGDIGVWAVPVTGGQSRPYLEGVAEFDWSRDGSRLVYHTPGPGDPMFVSMFVPRGLWQKTARPIFVAPAGLHSHFLLWSPDSAFVYFSQGLLPGKLDIWRIAPTGGSPERITSQNALVSHPVLLGRRTLLYLAGDPDGSGPWLYGTDVEHRIPHRLSSGLDRYTSLAASAEGRRLAVTRASPKRTLWRMRLDDFPAKETAGLRIPLTTAAGFYPRLGPDYLLYVSGNGAGESLWKIAKAGAEELWNGPGAQFLGAPAISSGGGSVAFSVAQGGKKLLYVMKSGGAKARIVTDSLDLRGAPAWEPGEQSITSAADDHGATRLIRIPADGRGPALFVREYSLDPAWSPDGRFAIYSGADIGTTFPVKAITAAGAPYAIPQLTLTRGARHLALLAGGRALVFLGGGIEHKNLWLLDLRNGAQRQLTDLPQDFEIRDFDISPDGREAILERVQEHSEVVLIDLAQGGQTPK